MRRWSLVAVTAACLTSACASDPTREADTADPVPVTATQSAELIKTSFAEAPESAPGPATGGDRVCEPKLVDERAVLADDCINVIDGVPYTGKRYVPVGREAKQLTSMCEYSHLPRCRR